MRLSDFLSTWEGHEAENRFSRLIILGLLVVCVITSLAAWRTERSIILVPPTLTKEVEVTRSAASSEFKESWGLFLAELLGNTTPAKKKLGVRSFIITLKSQTRLICNF